MRKTHTHIYRAKLSKDQFEKKFKQFLFGDKNNSLKTGEFFSTVVVVVGDIHFKIIVKILLNFFSVKIGTKHDTQTNKR